MPSLAELQAAVMEKLLACEQDVCAEGVRSISLQVRLKHGGAIKAVTCYVLRALLDNEKPQGVESEPVE